MAYPFEQSVRGQAANAHVGPRDVDIPPLGLKGTLCIPENAHSLVVFAHGSGSSRLSPRNVQVAAALNARGIGTLLFDLLLPRETVDRHNVFDINLLSERLLGVLRWSAQDAVLGRLPLGLFGASTGAAAALVAAASESGRVCAVVSRGGRPDLAGRSLERVKAPTLLLVGGADHGVIQLNRAALDQLTCTKALQIVPGATHLFEEPGALEFVTEQAAKWFRKYLQVPHNGQEE